MNIEVYLDLFSLEIRTIVNALTWCADGQRTTGDDHARRISS
jgi:hypothetical protein